MSSGKRTLKAIAVARYDCFEHCTSFNPLESMKLVHWPLTVTFSTARRGLGGALARPGPSLLYQM